MADAATTEMTDHGARMSQADQEPVEVRVYVVTGKHAFFKVPESFCRECDMFVRAADMAAERTDHPVEVKVVSWWWRVLGALRYGGYHAPVMVVGGQRLAQGYDVPEPERVVEAIERAAKRREREA